MGLRMAYLQLEVVEVVHIPLEAFHQLVEEELHYLDMEERHMEDMVAGMYYLDKDIDLEDLADEVDSLDLVVDIVEAFPYSSVEILELHPSLEVEVKILMRLLAAY